MTDPIDHAAAQEEAMASMRMLAVALVWACLVLTLACAVGAVIVL